MESVLSIAVVALGFLKASYCNNLVPKCTTMNQDEQCRIFGEQDADNRSFRESDAEDISMNLITFGEYPNAKQGSENRDGRGHARAGAWHGR